VGAGADEGVAHWDVLLVEDDQVLREQLAETLRDEGYRVTAVANGHEALAVVQSAQVGVMVLDLMMPVMTGWQLMQALSQLPEHAGLPTVVITAASNAHRANVRGGAPVFLKPLNLNSLLRAVRAYVGTPVP
jgi:CheY-like chemotaxis protein